MTELLDEIHPGEILLEDFMKPLGISARQLAAGYRRISQPHQRTGARRAADYR
ncbi:MAG: hypothetical protein Q8L93_09255 [Rhodocyclaceae bacterium]|nr:hypothetical protein [Rhodocyclaceae bacterium]MDP1957011.1 hypothetical protein [Rhodocyclaceae bacterium]